MSGILPQLLFSGLAIGCIYGLVGLGFIQVYNAVGLTNFAQGEFVMLGAYLFVSAVVIWKAPFWVGFLFLLVGMAVIGFLFTRGVYKPTYKAGRFAFLLASVGLSIALQDLVVLIWGPVPLYMPRLVSESSFNIGNVFINPQHIIIIGSTILLLIIQYLIFQKTPLGKMMRATAQDQFAATLSGIKVPLMIIFTFVNSSILAGIAGFLVGPVFSVTPSMGASAMLKGFVGCTIGGWGSIPGAVLGGILVGIIEIFSSFYISSAYKDAIVFLVLILFLLFKPKGIFGETVSEKV